MAFIGTGFFFLSPLGIECCQKRETLGFFVEHGFVDYDSSWIVVIQPFGFLNKRLHGFRG